MGKTAAPDALQAFVNARGRPAVIVSTLHSILTVEHVFELRHMLSDQRFEELDLVINSGGGQINAAYQIVELLRLHAAKLNACVPLMAKSAATLMCIGADEIFLDELAELGPLDTQVWDEKGAGGRGDYGSALNPFKTLEELQRFSLEGLDNAVKLIIRRSGVPMSDAIGYAIDYVGKTSCVLFEKLEPDKLGEYSRALRVGMDYGQRLLQRYSGWEEHRIRQVMERLVYNYPSHDYIIDYKELCDMGFSARHFSEDERPLVLEVQKALLADSDKVIILEPITGLPAPEAKETTVDRDCGEGEGSHEGTGMVGELGAGGPGGQEGGVAS